MKANLILENVKAYDVDKFDVKLGENFVLELEEAPAGIRWFSNNDPVLDIEVSDGKTSVAVKAASIGVCEIQLQVDREVVKTFDVEVYDHIAVGLNPEAGEPELK